MGEGRGVNMRQKKIIKSSKRVSVRVGDVKQLCRGMHVFKACHLMSEISHTWTPAEPEDGAVTISSRCVSVQPLKKLPTLGE